MDLISINTNNSRLITLTTPTTTRIISNIKINIMKSLITIKINIMTIIIQVSLSFVIRPSFHSQRLQVSSYYKMRSHFFVPRPSIEETTRPNWLKFCMQPPLGITRGIIEGFFDIWSGGPDMGYPWDPRRGPKILKFYFLDFFTFFDRNR